MKYLSAFLLFVLFTSCIPVKIAPHIKEDKVVKARKFKKGRSNDYAFVFKDTKDAGAFYDYINTKFERDNEQVDSNVPFLINKKPYFFSFSEIEKTTKTINLLPFFIDAALDNKDMDPMFEDSYTSHFGNWYILIQVYDIYDRDCLHPEYPDRIGIVHYLKALRIEYLNTQNYNEVPLK